MGTGSSKLGSAGKQTQAKLAELREKYGSGLIALDTTKEDAYKLAEMFTKETANENNFFQNSIGFWEETKRPRRKPDYVSMNLKGVLKGRDAKKSSEYWYTEDGVIRGSDHWGADVSSCSWFIKGRRYSEEGVSKGGKEYAFIPWSELKAKGYISKDRKTGKYALNGFTFKK